MEKLCKVLVGPKFVFEKIKFKVLYYQKKNTGENVNKDCRYLVKTLFCICQRPGLCKDQTNMFKRLVIVTLIADYEILLRTHSDDYIKGLKITKSAKYIFQVQVSARYIFYERWCAKGYLGYPVPNHQPSYLALDPRPHTPSRKLHKVIELV